ncbi:MAG: TlpA family protein disulfide reductase [Myxococcota bacterium]|nr:TlpA family protein disulfide reductase [Myxococcota bacterium]
MTTSALRIVSILSLAMALAACGSSPPATPDSGIALQDSGDGRACPLPEGTEANPIGTSLNRTLRAFTLNRCDGTPYEFYGEAEGFCEASFTVITLAAGWCVPCQMEAALLQSNVADAYADRDVRVVQVMLQNPDGTAATPAFCQDWVDTYDLRFPEVLDPDGTTWIFAPDNALPATVIVDSAGVIRYREYGTTANLSSLTAALDRLLAE